VPNTSSLLAIQTAIAAVLTGDATLVGLVGGAKNLRNDEPESPPSEFIVVGNATEQSWNTLGGPDAGWGWDVSLTIHIYSYYQGELKALQILNRVTALLNFQAVTVTGYPTVICQYGDDMTRVLLETADKQQRRHIPAMFSIKVHD
jgi:hypothetical protein